MIFTARSTIKEDRYVFLRSNMPVVLNGSRISSEGIPAYVRIDMATQSTELVKLEKVSSILQANILTGTFTDICASIIRLIFLTS